LYIWVFDLFIGMAGYPHSYLYSSSRGKCFYGMACHEVYVKPGGKLNVCVKLLFQGLEKTCAMQLFIILLEFQTCVP
jgi:hypothetical protein